jgi:hypothetical protein
MGKEGIKGFYNGINASLFRQVTYTTARLGTFQVLAGKDSSFAQKRRVLFGAIAGAVGGFVGTPADVVLIRMMADKRNTRDLRLFWSWKCDDTNFQGRWDWRTLERRCSDCVPSHSFEFGTVECVLSSKEHVDQTKFSRVWFFDAFFGCHDFWLRVQRYFNAIRPH